MSILHEFGALKKSGEVGIEIECEFDKDYPLPHPERYWVQERDNSLRGNSAEYVLLSPVSREDAAIALHHLLDKLDLDKAHQSERAGVHIHINVQELTRTQMFNFVTLYMIFEEMLVQWCGESRVGNLFCLRAVDADHLVTMIEEGAKAMAEGRSMYRVFSTDKMRYAAINLKALTTYGSLEFRSLQSVLDEYVLTQWISMLLKIKDKAKTYTNPVEIVESLSFDGPDAMFRDLFGENTTLEYDEEAAWRGVRLAQRIAYAIDDWPEEDYEPDEEEEEEEEEYWKLGQEEE